MIVMIIISFLCLVTDWVMHYYLPFSFGYLSIFTSMLTIVSILILRVYFGSNRKVYFCYIIILGLLYDILFSFIFFWNTLVFLTIGLILLKVKVNIIKQLKWCLLITIMIILYYDLIWFLTGLVFNYKLVLFDYLYKVYNSLFLNLLFIVVIIFLVIKDKKYQ